MAVNKELFCQSKVERHSDSEKNVKQNTPVVIFWERVVIMFGENTQLKCALMTMCSANSLQPLSL